MRHQVKIPKHITEAKSLLTWVVSAPSSRVLRLQVMQIHACGTKQDHKVMQTWARGKKDHLIVLTLMCGILPSE